MRKLIISAILAIAAFSVEAQGQMPPKAARTPYGDGETLLYNVSYRARLIPNINVMKVSLRTIAEELGGKTHYHVIGTGKTNKGVDGLFSINDTYHIWLDAATLLPSRMSSDQQENNYVFRSTYNYDWNAMSVSNVRRNAKWDADRRATIPLFENSGDPFSLFYRLRAVDASAMTPGRTYPIELVLNEESFPIAFTFLGREELKIKKVGTFRALKFTCTMATDDGTSFEEGMTMTVWISDDDNHLPLMFEIPVRVGRVAVTLTDGYRAIHPLDSLIE